RPRPLAEQPAATARPVRRAVRGGPDAAGGPRAVRDGTAAEAGRAGGGGLVRPPAGRAAGAGDRRRVGGKGAGEAAAPGGWAGALQRSGAAAEAEAVLRRGQRRHPTDVWLNFALAHHLHKKARPDRAEAVRFYTAARSLRPEVGHDLAHALEELDRHEEAVAIFEELCRLRPDNSRHVNCLAYALIKVGRLEEAVAVARKAMRLAPDRAGPPNNLGLALKDQGKLAEAEKAFREAIRLRPTYHEAHANLAS